MKTIIAILALLAATTRVCSAADPLPWPQFRGPNGSGIADGQSPPTEIGPEKNRKWKVPAPSGVSSPIVVKNMLVITAFDDGKLFTIAYDRDSGAELWRAEAPAEKIESYFKAASSPASSTSATDGQHIVSYFGSCGLFCYDLVGNELWKHELPPAETAGAFGSGVSPVIADGAVVLVRDVLKSPTILVLDARSGDVIWEKQRESICSYGTPAVWDTPQGKQIAVPGVRRMIGYDLKTGAERWYVEGMPSASCTSPVVAGGNLFFAGWSPGDPEDSEFKMPTFDDFLNEGDADKDGILSKEESQKTSMKDFFDSSDANKDGKYTREENKQQLDFMTSSRNSAFALRPGGAGNVTETHVIWKQKRGLPYVPSAIVYDGQHVMVKDGGILTAYDAETGKELYQKRALPSGSYYASPIAANGHLYFASMEEGVVTVLKGGADSPTVVTENASLGERIIATPAIADDTLYIRTDNNLWAFTNKVE
jgi:outer membrane protein assembly factor BamB